MNRTPGPWRDRWSSGTLVALCLVCLALAGCGGRDYEGPQRFPLSGKVTYDGQPIDYGAISFLPQNNKQRPSGGLIQNGTYNVTEEYGANAGPHRVEIRWHKLTGGQYRDPDTGKMEPERKEALPPRFHEKSELTVDVSDKQTNFDFELSSK